MREPSMSGDPFPGSLSVDATNALHYSEADLESFSYGVKYSKKYGVLEISSTLPSDTGLIYTVVWRPEDDDASVLVLDVESISTAGFKPCIRLIVEAGFREGGLDVVVAPSVRQLNFRVLSVNGLWSTVRLDCRTELEVVVEQNESCQTVVRTSAGRVRVDALPGVTCYPLLESWSYDLYVKTTEHHGISHLPLQVTGFPYGGNLCVKSDDLPLVTTLESLRITHVSPNTIVDLLMNDESVKVFWSQIWAKRGASLWGMVGFRHPESDMFFRATEYPDGYVVEAVLKPLRYLAASPDFNSEYVYFLPSEDSHLLERPGYGWQEFQRLISSGCQMCIPSTDLIRQLRSVRSKLWTKI